MRFLADMGISTKTVSLLHNLGYEAIHLHDQHLDRMPDSHILAKAREEGYVLLTNDLDFGELMAASKSSLPSVVIFRLRNMHPERVNFYMRRIMSLHKDLLEQGAIISVTEGQIRIRSLPIEDEIDFKDI